MNILLSGIIKVGYSDAGYAIFLAESSEVSSLWDFFPDILQTHLLFKNPDSTVSHMFNLVSIFPLFLSCIIPGVRNCYSFGLSDAGVCPCAIWVLVCKSIVTELGPMITAMVFAGRVATELLQK